ncbi:MAG TPA: M15 family metallopeptidase [Acidimicrobiales bacterium]|nr:M15 family metallopeptidase [Acidimicrobiales bacterium]
MKRLVIIIGAALAGGVLGGGVMLAIQATDSDPQDAAPPLRASAERTATTTTTRPPTEEPDPTATTAPQPAPSVLLAWSRNGDQRGLDPGLEPAAAAAPDVSATSLVRAGNLDLVGSRSVEGAPVDDLAPGWAIPLDAVAVDPARHAEFIPIADRDAISTLGPGEAVLGRTSAELRRLGPGGVIELAAGQSVVVSSVVEDASIGGAELAVDVATGARLGLASPRYLLVAYDGDRPALENRLRAALARGTVVQFRGPGETPYLRQADAVLPQAQIKARFGEFSYRTTVGDAIEPDPAWESESIVTREVPLLGQVRCHRGIIDALVGALTEIERAGLAALVHQAGYDGCFVPRFVAGSDSLSRHAWGAAFDIGVSTNPTGVESAQDPRLVEIFRRWGFTSGDSWLIPDAGHFEYVEPAG